MKKMNKTILVVDDEADVRNYLKSALENSGFDVITANNGLEALEVMAKTTPDLISLDLVMPKHSGIRFYRDIQKNKDWAKIPVLIITGHARDELGKVDFETMMMTGPGVYLEKPVKPFTYIEKVCQLLGLEVPENIAQMDKDSEEEQRKKMLDSLSKADTESLKKALDAIKKNQ
jgi:two-component system alkaline phosphatase synthesis response regulator PhoP